MTSFMDVQSPNTKDKTFLAWFLHFYIYILGQGGKESLEIRVLPTSFIQLSSTSANKYLKFRIAMPVFELLFQHNGQNIHF